MSTNPLNPISLTLAGATLPFVRYIRDGLPYIEFDSCGCRCPVPMHNAMLGLERIASSGERLVMVNGFEPAGLFERVRGGFVWQVEPLPQGRVRIVFNATAGASQIDFSERGCNGG
ncbi:hypothetical protein [Aestuariirhabdus sp. LZHN29]|uniref:hypothetical protein n=1 Tax=Aestuariirhabdus sp. LZHN29 TaxID=3417462 RepID=UPI003CEA7310